MQIRQWTMAASALAMATGLTACGGGGGGMPVVSTPPPPAPAPPPPPPPPAPDTSVELLAAPGNEITVLATGSPIDIRYDQASNQYQVMAGGEGWTALVDDPQSNTTPNQDFVFASRTDWPGGSSFRQFAHHRQPHAPSNYRYSNLAAWSLQTATSMEDQVRSGVVAFGQPTPAGSVPTTGAATYSGMAHGTSNFNSTSWGGDYPNVPIYGNVTLGFNFASGTLHGQLQPFIGCDCDDWVNFPILQFTDTIFGVGSRTFSGRFATDIEGPNNFSGLFTGPNAEELIGRWAFPFTFEGENYSAEGAWIAKRAPN